MKTTRTFAAAMALCGALALTACSSGGEPPATQPPAPQTETKPAAAAWDAPVEFWGWAPGYENAVKAWNTANPDKKVNYEQISSGSQGGYQKMLTAVKAGNAPCLGQVGYETFTSFLAAGALEDVTAQLANAKGDFPDWVWNQVTVGGKTYGVPVDTGPMAMFYRADKFKEAKIDVPKTWDEFKAAAEKIKAYDSKSRIYNFGNDAYNFSGFPWQAGAKWFGTENDAWSVSINSADNKKVADYWQGLLDADLLATSPAWDAALYKSWSEGTVWTEVGAVWTAGLLKSEAKGASGKWAVAPMPTWTDSDAVGNVGGSATAVLKGCKTPDAAAEFAAWLSTSTDAWQPLISEGALYPASTPAMASPLLTEGDEYFGGQKIYDLFATESTKVNTDWQWGPVMTATATALGDGLGKAQSKAEKLPAVLDATQTKTVEEIKAQGYSVNE